MFSVVGGNGSSRYRTKVCKYLKRSLSRDSGELRWYHGNNSLLVLCILFGMQRAFLFAVLAPKLSNHEKIKEKNEVKNNANEFPQKTAHPAGR